jgi:hypothetical protein
VIAGHTHRPGSAPGGDAKERTPAEMREELHKLREAGGLPEQLGDLRAELELVQTEACGEPQ